jgi:hypothetical protein
MSKKGGEEVTQVMYRIGLVFAVGHKEKQCRRRVESEASDLANIDFLLSSQLSIHTALGCQSLVSILFLFLILCLFLMVMLNLYPCNIDFVVVQVSYL